MRTEKKTNSENARSIQLIQWYIILNDCRGNKLFLLGYKLKYITSYIKRNKKYKLLQSMKKWIMKNLNYTKTVNFI